MSLKGRDCVKTPTSHFGHVNFGHVRAIARDLSTTNCVLGHVRGWRFEFSHSLDPSGPVRLLKRSQSEEPKRSFSPRPRDVTSASCTAP